MYLSCRVISHDVTKRSYEIRNISPLLSSWEKDSKDLEVNELPFFDTIEHHMKML